jgi:hypothetical protein
MALCWKSWAQLFSFFSWQSGSCDGAPRATGSPISVVVRRGLIVRTRTDVPLGKVKSVRFRQGIADRVFGVATLLVQPGVFRPATLRCVRDPHEACLKIQEGQRAAPLPPVGPRFGSPPQQHTGLPFGSTSPFATPPPPPAPAAPVGRFGGDGPPIPPWAKGEE